MSKLVVPEKFEKLSNTGSNHQKWLRAIKDLAVGQGHGEAAAVAFKSVIPVWHGCHADCWMKSEERDAFLPMDLLGSLEIPEGSQPFQDYRGAKFNRDDVSPASTPVKPNGKRRSSGGVAMSTTTIANDNARESSTAMTMITRCASNSISSSSSAAINAVPGAYGWYEGDPFAVRSWKIKKSNENSYMKEQSTFVASLEMLCSAILASLDDLLHDRAMQSVAFKVAIENKRPDVAMLIIDSMMSYAGIGEAKPVVGNLSIISDFRKLVDMKYNGGDLLEFIIKFNNLVDKIHTQGFNPKRDKSVDILYGLLMIAAVGSDVKYEQIIVKADTDHQLEGDKLGLDYAEAMVKKWNNEVDSSTSVVKSFNGTTKTAGRINKAEIKRNFKRNNKSKKKTTTSGSGGKQFCNLCKKDDHWPQHCPTAGEAVKAKWKEAWAMSMQSKK